MTWLLSLLTLARSHRKVLTLFAVLAVGAAFYVQWQAAALRGARAAGDRAALIGVSDATCAALGSEFRPAGVKRSQWGVACLAEARRLGAIEEDLATGSLDLALAAMADQHGKDLTDAALAAAMSKRTADAVAQMEAANAAIEDDRVGPGWAAAVNDLGGLRR